tara:strand:+ start:3761 stop:3964 length:204 start_codon:yes stop_codon:yes gene_type:complete
MNCTTGGRKMINERRISQKSIKQGFTAIFAKKNSTIECWTKFLGHHTIQGHKQIGWKNNLTGKITKL